MIPTSRLVRRGGVGWSGSADGWGWVRAPAEPADKRPPWGGWDGLRPVGWRALATVTAGPDPSREGVCRGGVSDL